MPMVMAAPVTAIGENDESRPRSVPEAGDSFFQTGHVARASQRAGAAQGATTRRTQAQPSLQEVGRGAGGCESVVQRDK